MHGNFGFGGIGGFGSSATVSFVDTSSPAPAVSGSAFSFGHPGVRQPGPNNMVADFARLYNNQEGSDVTFSVQGATYYAHSLCLMARAPLFWDEVSQGQTGNQIEIQGMSQDVFDGILKYVYMNTVHESVKFDELAELLYKSDTYKLADLKNICEHRLAQAISAELVLSILRLSKDANAATLEVFALDFIRRQWGHNATLKAAIRNYDIRSPEDGKMFQEILCHMLRN